MALCDAFKALCATSYDILAEIWAASPDTKSIKGLNSLDAIAQANGYGGKTGHGAQAPYDWAAGRWADVLNYCSNDVYLTQQLFEQIADGFPIQRSNGSSLMLRTPFPERGECMPEPASPVLSECIVQLLVLARRPHDYCDEDSFYTCPKHPEGFADEIRGRECTCGAEAHNAEVERLEGALKQALHLRPPFPPAGHAAAAPRLRFNDEAEYYIEAL